MTRSRVSKGFGSSVERKSRQHIQAFRVVFIDIYEQVCYIHLRFEDVKNPDDALRHDALTCERRKHAEINGPVREIDCHLILSRGMNEDEAKEAIVSGFD